MSGRSQKRPNRRPIFNGYQVYGTPYSDGEIEKADYSLEALWPGRDIKAIRENIAFERKRNSFVFRLCKYYKRWHKDLYSSHEILKEIYKLFEEWNRENPDGNYDEFYAKFKEYNKLHKLTKRAVTLHQKLGK